MDVIHLTWTTDALSRRGLVCDGERSVLGIARARDARPSIVIISERRTARGCSQQGVRFDPDMPQTIRLEFAKSNTKVSKPKPAVATAAPAAHPALMHPLTGRKYRRTHTPPGARSKPLCNPYCTSITLIKLHDLCLCRSSHYNDHILTAAATLGLKRMK